MKPIVTDNDDTGQLVELITEGHFGLDELTLMQWALGEALKALFKKEFPEYFNSNNN